MGEPLKEFMRAVTTAELPKELPDREKAVINMKLAGMDNSSIAQVLNLSEPAIVKILSDPQVKAYRLRLESVFSRDFSQKATDVAEEIKLGAIEAAHAVREIMREMRADPSPRAQRVALSSAQDILDRAGHVAKQKVEVAAGVVIHPDTLRGLRDVIKELKEPSENGRSSVGQS